MPTTNPPSVHQLKRAVEISEQIARLEGELNAILNRSSAAAAPAAAPASKGRPGRRRKGTLSPEARERIAAAQRARWAKAKGTKVSAAPAAAPAQATGKRRKRRAVSAEARAKMAEAARRRWAASRK